MLTDEAALVDDLHAMTDGGLRAVATYDRDGYDLVYARDGLEAHIADRAPAIHRNLILEGIGTAHLEDLFRAGDLHCSMHRFEEVTAFHFVAGEYTGLFVSVDSGADVPLATFSDRCEAALSGED
ncbi:MAG: hypothetical protein ABEJ68_03060 [Halobacteriaceae archaeon]